MKEEVRIIGIMRERDVEQEQGKINLKVLKKIMDDCLQLEPMWIPLMDVLKKTNQLNGDQLEFKAIFNALHSSQFQQTTPLVSTSC